MLGKVLRRRLVLEHLVEVPVIEVLDKVAPERCQVAEVGDPAGAGQGARGDLHLHGVAMAVQPRALVSLGKAVKYVGCLEREPLSDRVHAGHPA
jgi:hypothetical protein